MRLPKRHFHGQASAADTLTSALTACIVVMLVASFGGLMALLANMHFTPRLGDILVFRSESSVSDLLKVTATRSVPDPRLGHWATTCTLDPTVMARDGGSLVVETKSLTAPVFGVHWVGRQTSNGAANCGSSADLTLSRADLQTLVNAVGGMTISGDGNVL